MITILSIDGGGVRGIIPAVILEELERRTQRPLCTMFDYMAGTSTGGIISAMLAIPGKNGKPAYTASQVRECYERLGEKVFSRSFLRIIFTLNGLIYPKYSPGPLEKALKEHFGNTPLNLALTRLILPAYEMNGCVPWFFKSASASGKPGELDNPFMSQAVMASSAAPSYFPPYRIKRGTCFIDGGIYAGNPAACAFAQAKKDFPKEKDFFIVSLGTGEYNEHYGFYTVKRWGRISWLLPIFTAASNSSSACVDYQMKALAGEENYRRFQVKLHKSMRKIDNGKRKNVEGLKKLATDFIKENSRQIDEICTLLSFGH